MNTDRSIGESGDRAPPGTRVVAQGPTRPSPSGVAGRDGLLC